MKELREQLTMYESASQYGIFPNSSSNPSVVPSSTHDGLDDSYAQLGIRKSNSGSAASTTLKSVAESTA